jgi:hypothetical protein
MLRDLSTVVSPILALLLVVLMPVGSVTGAHRDQLFDPIFPHVHLGNGPPLRQVAPPPKPLQHVVAQAQRGPALGAGAAAAAAALGMGLTPPLPSGTAVLMTETMVRRLWPIKEPPRGRLAEAPPDPPPSEA